MREIGALEAKTRFRMLLDLVVGGEEVVITRRGKPIARLVPEKRPFDWEETRPTVITPHD